MKIDFKLHPNSAENNFLRLTLKCNSNCYFCNTDENTPNLVYELDDIYTAVDKIKEKFSRIIISGGEPTLLSGKLLKIIKYIKEKGFSNIVLQTNGILLSNSHFVKKLKETGVIEIFLSLHSHDPIIDEQICHVDFWSNKILAIKNILKQGMSLELNYVINQFNYKYLKDFITFYHENFYPGARLCISYVSPAGKMNKYLDIYPKYSDVLPWLSQMFDYVELHGLKNIQLMANACGIPKCLIKKYIQFTRLERVTFINSNDRLKLAICTQCRYNDYCDGIWKKYVEIYGTNEFFSIN